MFRLFFSIGAFLRRGAVALCVLGAAQAHADGVWALRAGDFYWMPELSPQGPVVAVANLHTQTVQVYRNGVTIGISSMSSGKPGKRTPTGLYAVLEKRRKHFSNRYGNAPMPFMLRLTWHGVALHAGVLPGYPASHGCLRLPRPFAAQLFEAIARGDPVAIVQQESSESDALLHMLSPIDPQGQPLLPADALTQDDAPWWAAQPHEEAPLAPTSAALPSASAPTATQAAGVSEQAAPLMLLASLPQQRMFVLRQGRLLATLPLPQQTPAQDAADADSQAQRIYRWDGQNWLALGEGSEDDAQHAGDALWNALLLMPGFHRAPLLALMAPGSTLLITRLHATATMHRALHELVTLPP